MLTLFGTDVQSKRNMLQNSSKHFERVHLYWRSKSAKLTFRMQRLFSLVKWIYMRRLNGWPRNYNFNFSHIFAIHLDYCEHCWCKQWENFAEKNNTLKIVICVILSTRHVRFLLVIRIWVALVGKFSFLLKFWGFVCRFSKRKLTRIRNQKRVWETWIDGSHKLTLKMQPHILVDEIHSLRSADQSVS